MRLGMSEAHSALEPTRNERELHLPSRNPAMNSLFTSAFWPAFLSLGLLLVMATGFVTPAPAGGVTSNKPSLTTPGNVEQRVKYMLSKISELRKELCSKFDKCNDQDAVSANNMHLPKLEDKDGCFQSGYNQDICALRFTSGLLEYEIYLEYVQSSYDGDKDKAKNLEDSIKALVQALQEKMKNFNLVCIPSPSAREGLLFKLKSQAQWLKNSTIYLIMKGFEDFLEIGIRAVRNY
ncbi:interleukin-6 [Manis pentadactyla]|uniref:interleukin-6 n=1 Tax=Manis pentadactyla TaxID=143292 RepID=UPI00255CEE15|nr:interleukin-6 [Manis pentadactyla]KAI5250865.1 Interleukin-6 [Manis pentadactyla]